MPTHTKSMQANAKEERKLPTVGLLTDALKEAIIRAKEIQKKREEEKLRSQKKVDNKQ